MNIKTNNYQSKLFILTLMILIPFGLQAGNVGTTFSPSATLTAAQMTEIADAVNDNDVRVSNLFGGDGSGGDITIGTANDNWNVIAEIPADLDFANFTIPAGVTLTVPAGTTIRCSGSFTNAGTISVSAGARHQTTGFSSTGNSASSGPMNTIHPGDALSAATNGQFDNNAIAIAKSLQGGSGGVGIPEAVARTSFAQFRIGGGAGAGNTSINSGGGLIKVYCTGPISNTDTINATGSNGGSTGSGGGGGIVILASQTSVDNSAGSIDVSGGTGGNASGSFFGSSGGGGGGIVMMISPVAPLAGTTIVLGGTGGSAGTATTQSRLAGSGGGASGGHGGNGGFVGTTGTASAGITGQNGYVITMTTDPVLLAH